MASSHKGKIFLFSLLLLFQVSSVFRAFAESVATEDKLENLGLEQKFEHADVLDMLKRNQLQLEKLVEKLSLLVSQLEKLEELVEKHSLLVSRVESILLEYPIGKNLEDEKQSSEGIKQVVLNEKMEIKRIQSDLDSLRNADLMDLRGSSLRCPSGRYVCPSRYSGGSAGAYRSNSSDTNSRPSSIDPNFRTTLGGQI